MCVARELLTSGQKVRWLNLRDSTMVAPAWMHGVVQRPWAAPWYKGMHVYILSVDCRFKARAAWCPTKSSRPVGMMTPFGRPVVPEV
jgi:hypothetical protein